MNKLTIKTLIPVAMMGLCLVAGPGYAAGAADQGHDHHDHATQETGGLVLNEGERWATDAALREGMERVRASFAEVLPAYQRGEFSHEAATDTARAIDDHVAFLVENCKLEPAADAVLHVLVAELLQGTATLRKAPASPEGLPRIHGVLRDYPRYFDHTGWEGPTD
ncbi:MAG: hypothetical protein OQL11_05790 [Gammaproteobacteria bacterium]|nr:hypothetical protein [Gammaproteobacteria bacterium]